jgi:hypothetical protein
MFLEAFLRIFDIVCLKNMIRVDQLSLKINWAQTRSFESKKGGNYEKQ